jgi:GMP synthase (glutamine-hydrolysing)
MRKLLVFQHVPFEPLGTLDAQFRQAGFRIRYVNFDRQPDMRVDVGRYHGLVVLGGPMGADELERHPNLAFEQDAIRRAAEAKLPVLGICLGAQLIAAALGGQVLRGAAPEYGWTRVAPTAAGREDPLIGNFRARETIYQWHSDTFTLPEGAVHLASTTACPLQAFRIGDCVYGLQFHLEADRALIRRWLSVPEHLAELAERGVVVDERGTLAETERHLPRATALGRQVFGEFIERFYQLRRRRAQPSR